MNLFAPRTPDEYYIPQPDDGSWYYQSQLDEQELENDSYK